MHTPHASQLKRVGAAALFCLQVPEPVHLQVLLVGTVQDPVGARVPLVPYEPEVLVKLTELIVAKLHEQVLGDDVHEQV